MILMPGLTLEQDLRKRSALCIDDKEVNDDDEYSTYLYRVVHNVYLIIHLQTCKHWVFKANINPHSVIDQSVGLMCFKWR